MPPCQGKRRPNGALLGICVTCDRQDSRATLPTVAARMCADWAVWVCDERQYAPKLGRAHSDSASRLNVADSDSSAATMNRRTAAAAQAL